MISTEPRFRSQVAGFQAKHRRRQLWRKIVSTLACVVVFCTTYALILPAITMEAPRVLECPLVVHSHTAECYDEDDNLICAQADFVVHTHDDDCFDENGDLVCTLPEIEAHEHTEDCYMEKRTLICGEEEDLGHEHGEACYTWIQADLICALEEEPGHEHTEECYRTERTLACGEEEDPGHIHGEACYLQRPRKLICTLEENGEHQHTKECYVTCGLDEDLGHAHSAECYETTEKLTCGLEEDGEHQHTEACYSEVEELICGEREREPGHIHTEECHKDARELICTEEERAPGHIHSEGCYEETRELICEEDERAPGHVHDKYCYDWVQELTCVEEERPAAHVHTDDCYEIETVLTCEEEEIILHEHTGACYDEDGNWICGQLEILEHVHTDACFRLIEEEKPAFAGPYTYEDDSVAVEVTLAEGSTVPEGAELVVRPITGMATFSADGGSDYDYEELVRQAEEAVDKEVTEIVLYDISFYTLEGEYLPVADTATVSLRFKEAVLTGDMGEVAVLHYPEDADLPVALESVDVERDEDDALSGVTFQTEGFSVFGVAMLADTADSNTFTWTCNPQTITFHVVDETGKAINGSYSNQTVSSNIQYSLPPDGTNENLLPTITGYQFHGAKYNDQDVGYIVFVNYYGETPYILLFENIYDYPSPIYDSNIDITLTYSGGGTETTDYSGDWAIVNMKSDDKSGVAMLADAIGTSGNRAGRTVAVEQKDGSYLVSDSTVTVWHFQKQTDGTYYIFTTVDDKLQYLTIGEKSDDPVTLSGQPQAITVESGTGTHAGMVRLVANDQTVYLFNGSASQGFGSNLRDDSDNAWHTLCQVTSAQGGTLRYNLNFPYVNGNPIPWMTTPALDSSTQNMGTATELFAKPKGSYDTTGPAGLEGLYRFYVNNLDQLSQEDFYKNFDWYGEYRFDGWEYVDESKVTHLFAPEAAITQTDTGEIKVTDVAGNEVTLPAAGATLTGKWTEVSNVVTLFVNYTGTILDVEGDVSGRNGNDFTRSVAVGHVFYGKQTVGDNDTFGTNANAAISAMFQPEFDADNPDTQIVIEYLRRCTKSSTTGIGYTTKVDLAYHGANSNVLEENTLKLIKETGRTIRLSTSNNDNPEIDNALCDTDHYEVRWYVLKEQMDTWHIDGVLVAKTEELAVTKTFTGLSDQQVINLLDEASGKGFNISVALGEKGSSQPYITMLPQNQSNGKQYVYTGQEGKIHSYLWTLYTINGEKYTLTENSYVLNGYDVSNIVVEYYLDESGDTKIHYTYGDSTDDFPAEVPQVEGGRTIAVSFNNLYTQTGTGAFAITKREEGTDPSSVGGTLSGAVFTLTDANGKKVGIATSNINGTVYFNNLPAGTYTLEETKAPEGYTASNHTWTVVVENTNGRVVVTAYENDASGARLTSDSGTVCYDSNRGGVQKSYEIYNISNRNAVTVRKTFTGITTEELNAVIQQSVTDLAGTPKGYYIQLQGTVESGNVHDGETIDVTRTLDQAQRLQDGRTFVWTIHNLHVDNTTYTITEHNYLHNSYIDAVVSARLNGAAVAATEDAASGTCQISGVQFRADASDTVIITNHYTNTFDLKLMKVDSGEAHTPLAGAVFDIYGNYNDSTNVQKTVTYEENGVTKTAYYIGTTSHSGADGIATYSGLRLSKEGSTFVYVIKEFQSPNGYVKLDEPIIHTVTIDSDGYDGGVFSFTAENTRAEHYVHRTLDTQKVWSSSTPPTGATVTLELYRVVHEHRGVPLGAVADAELIASVSLDGTADGAQTIDDGAITAYESAPWVATWTNLPSAADTYDTDGAHYHYFVREAVTVPGYATSYTCYDLYDEVPNGAIQTLQVGNETFQGVLIADMDDAYTATVVNTSNFELPETGGMGTLPYAMGGALLIAGCLLYGYLLRRKKERRSAR